MKLTEDNYYSEEANSAYMSASQLKRFMQCERMAIAELNGDWQQEDTTALLVGSYVDAYFSGEEEKFTNEHPEIYTKTGSLRAEYKQANDIITTIRADDLFSRMMSGEKQKIVKGEIYGVPFRGKIDSFLSAEQCQEIAKEFPQMAESMMLADGAIVDLKIMRDMESIFIPGRGRVSFVQAWRYDLQLAIYQKLIGKKVPCFIACVTKERIADKEIIHIPQYMLDTALSEAEEYIKRAEYLKQHNDEAMGCGKCDYCKKVKVLSKAIGADELDGAII